MSTATLRRVAGAAVGFVVLLVLAVLWSRSGLEADLLVPIGSADGPDQTVRIRARQTTTLKVTVDEAVAFDGPVPGGEEHTFAGRDRVVVELPATGAVAIEYNGESIVPQGRQDTPRTLVFVDDGAPWRSRPGASSEPTPDEAPARGGAP